MSDTETLQPGDTRRSSTEQSGCTHGFFKRFFFIAVAEPQRLKITVERDQPALVRFTSDYEGSRESLDSEDEMKGGRARLEARVDAGVYRLEVMGETAGTFTVSVEGGNGRRMTADEISTHLTGTVSELKASATDLAVLEVAYGAPLPPPGQRRFSSSFNAGPDLRVAAVLTLRMPPASGSASVPLVCTLFDGRGMALSTAMGTTTPPAGATEVTWSPGPMDFGGRVYGGLHRVICAVDDGLITEPLASVAFEVRGAAAPSEAAEAEYIEAFNQGVALHTSGDLAAAERAFERALATGVLRGEAALQMAIILGNRGEFDRSLELSIQAAEAGTGQAMEVLEKVSDRAYSAGHLLLSSRGYEYLARRAPTTWRFWNAWAHALHDQEEWETLVEVAGKAVELDPNHRNTLLLLAHGYKNTGQAERAREMAARAAALPKSER